MKLLPCTLSCALFCFGLHSEEPIPPSYLTDTVRSTIVKKLKNGTSGMRDFAIHFTDMEVWINVTGVLRAFEQIGKTESLPFTKDMPILLGGDLRSSTPQIMKACAKAIRDHGPHPILNAGFVPTPVLALYAKNLELPCIMVTGSHIRGDMNGIKFYYVGREVLDDDVAKYIVPSIETVRRDVYSQQFQDSFFTPECQFKKQYAKEAALLLLEKGVFSQAVETYVSRFVSFFGTKSFLCTEDRPLHILYLQQSTVARDIHPQILRSLGLDVDTEGGALGRLDSFMAMDSENVTPELQKMFQGEAEAYHERHGFYADAILTADGDGDRPFVLDGKGTFYRGDILNLLAVKVLGAHAVVTPISSNVAVGKVLEQQHIPCKKVKIGSPKVILAGMKLHERFGFSNVYTWEVNGGGIQITDILTKEGKCLPALPTRDSLLPILCALHLMTVDSSGNPGFRSLSQVFHDEVEQISDMATQAGLKVMASEKTSKILAHFSALPKTEKSVEEIRFLSSGKVEVTFAENSSSDLSTWLHGSKTLFSEKDNFTNKVCSIKQELETYFTKDFGFGSIVDINWLDGIQIFFENGTIAHLRASGNAPEWRIYIQASGQEMADLLVEKVLQKDGVYDQLAKAGF